MNILKTLLGVLVICETVSSLLTPVVEISQGKLRGSRSLFGQNRYYNIPYAVADRFQVNKQNLPILFLMLKYLNILHSMLKMVIMLKLKLDRRVTSKLVVAVLGRLSL